MLRYSIVPSPPTTDLFYVNPSTGVLSLKAVWENKEETKYEVKNTKENKLYIYEASLQKGLHDAIYQSLETRSKSIIYQFWAKLFHTILC